jgi:hypothetical protein
VKYLSAAVSKIGLRTFSLQRSIGQSYISPGAGSLNLDEGSGYFFHGKMPGCCLPSLAAATALHFTAGYLNIHSNENRRLVLPFSAAIALCPLEAPGR